MGLETPQAPHGPPFPAALSPEAGTALSLGDYFITPPFSSVYPPSPLPHAFATTEIVAIHPYLLPSPAAADHVGSTSSPLALYICRRRPPSELTPHPFARRRLLLTLSPSPLSQPLAPLPQQPPPLRFRLLLRHTPPCHTHHSPDSCRSVPAAGRQSPTTSSSSSFTLIWTWVRDLIHSAA